MSVGWNLRALEMRAYGVEGASFLRHYKIELPNSFASIATSSSSNRCARFAALSTRTNLKGVSVMNLATAMTFNNDGDQLPVCEFHRALARLDGFGTRPTTSGLPIQCQWCVLGYPKPGSTSYETVIRLGSHHL